MIPTLQTQRLILRAPRQGDFDTFAAFYAGPRASFVGGPLTRELAWRMLAIGKAGATNAALLAIAMLGVTRPALRRALAAFRADRAQQVMAEELTIDP